MGLTIRKIRSDELEKASALAMRSKAHWGYSPSFMAACVDELTYGVEDLAKGDFWVAVDSGQRWLGFYGLLPLTTVRWELEALFVDPPCIGKGVGRALWQHMIAISRQRGIEVIEIQSDPDAVGFYLSMGAIKVGEKASGSIPGRVLPLFRVTLSSDGLPL